MNTQQAGGEEQEHVKPEIPAERPKEKGQREQDANNQQ